MGVGDEGVVGVDEEEVVVVVEGVDDGVVGRQPGDGVGRIV